MHCIWTLPEGDDDFSSRWREIKKQFTHACGLKNIWQPRFWEHAIRNTKDYRHHVDYIYINPVKHGWVKQVSDWPFSTFHRDVAKGLYPIDWAGDVTDFSAGSVSFYSCAPMPDATQTRLIMPTKPHSPVGRIRRSRRIRRLCTGARCAATRLIMPTKPHSPVGRIRRSRRIRQYAPMPDAYINAPIIFNSSSSSTSLYDSTCSPGANNLA